MATYRMGPAAQLLGVSADTLRRWVDAGRVPAGRDGQGHRVIEGSDLAAFARSMAADEPGGDRSSARNRFTGIVTAVRSDTVMAQVEIQAGPHRIVSLMTREAADELGLVVGALATATVKSTQVVVELPTTTKGTA
ncbi:TOBE domain-containing protein [Actinocatenispora rupis]|uniref:MerR family transcriptional regulator n=1 Tax=Actinocatenispora rupis TaxID=519421 RepID=A0A8J3NGG0_9ACTN|nr:helix-turn-helix transcriptional regulator [Actinocatenispora rupis]GID16387.1 MerR family transcriptional regulator [Actinocatenispora rupis]